MNYIEQKQEIIEIAKTHKKEMNQEVRYSDKDHHIKNGHNSMGEFSLQGYVNGDKNLDFGIIFDKYSEKIECRLYTSCPKIGKWKGF